MVNPREQLGTQTQKKVLNFDSISKLDPYYGHIPTLLYATLRLFQMKQCIYKHFRSKMDLSLGYQPIIRMWGGGGEEGR